MSSINKFETVFLLRFGIFFAIHFREKHLLGSDVQPSLAVERAVHDKLLPRLTVARKSLHIVEVALEMTVQRVLLQLSHLLSPFCRSAPIASYAPAGQRK